MGRGRQKFVPSADCTLYLLIQPRVVNGDDRLGGDAHRQVFRAFRKYTNLLMPEEQSTHNFSGPRFDRHGEIAADGQMPVGQAVVRRILTVARIPSHIVEPHYSTAAKRGPKDRRVSRHREVAEPVAGNAGYSVEQVRLAAVIDAVIEEGAELGTSRFSRSVGDRLNDAVEVELRGQDSANPVECLDKLCVFAGSLPGTHQVRDLYSMHEDVFDIAVAVEEGFVDEVYV